MTGSLLLCMRRTLFTTLILTNIKSREHIIDTVNNKALPKLNCNVPWIYYALDNEQIAFFHLCMRPTVVLVNCICFEVSLIWIVCSAHFTFLWSVLHSVLYIKSLILFSYVKKNGNFRAV